MIWRLRKKNQRQRQRNLNRVLNITPPSSPMMLENVADGDAQIIYAQDAAENVNPPNVLQNMNVPIVGCGSPAPSNTSRNGRKKVRRDRSKLYKENEYLKKENERLKQKYERYKKKLQRSKKKKENTKKDDKEKYKTLSNAIKDKYHSIKKRKDKSTFKSVFEKMDTPAKNEIVKDALGLSCKLRTTETFRESASQLKQKIQDFYERDDISRATAGRKDTITKDKTKVQKRFLLDTMINLYRTFKQENPESRCSLCFFMISNYIYARMAFV